MTYDYKYDLNCPSCGSSDIVPVQPTGVIGYVFIDNYMCKYCGEQSKLTPPKLTKVENNG